MNNKIFVCGDIHCPIDIKKLNTTKWKEQKKLTKDDVLIQLGDCGLVWYYKNNKKIKEDLYWQKQMANKNFTFTFLDGNHENHDLLSKLPIKEKWGGKVGVISTVKGNIYYLKRGEIYTINNKKILIIGGAKSNDIESRTENKNWWKKETLLKEEIDNIYLNLNKHNWKVDFVCSHTCPKEISLLFFSNLKHSYSNMSKINTYTLKTTDPTTEILQNLIDNGLKFKEWHFGHWHNDIQLNKQFFCHYNNQPYEIINKKEYKFD